MRKVEVGVAESAGIKLGRLNGCTFEQALELRNKGFEGYYSNMETTMDDMLQSFGVHHIRPELSVVACVEDRPVGFVFLAFKTVDGVKLAWNGGTGVFPEYRGRGIAKAMMQEAQHIIAEQQVDRAILEVVTRNGHAIAAYQSGGFQIEDHIIGLTRTGPLIQPFGLGGAGGFHSKRGKSRDVRALSFYRDKAAWECLWHNIREGESIVVYDYAGTALAYALFKRSYDESEQLKSIVLFQCEVSPACTDKPNVFRMLLDEVYGPYDLPCTRQTANLSTAHAELIRVLMDAGFETNYEQYLMILDKQ